jgi:hypothetical protein
MILHTDDICNYLKASKTVAVEFKRQVLQSTEKKTKYITLADLANYEQLSINEVKELINLKK